MMIKISILITCCIVLATLVTAQKLKKNSLCTEENTNTTCATFCEVSECLRGACICSTPLFPAVQKRYADRKCHSLSRKRKRNERVNKCIIEDELYRDTYCCLHPRILELEPETTENPDTDEVEPVDGVDSPGAPTEPELPE